MTRQRLHFLVALFCGMATARAEPPRSLADTVLRGLTPPIQAELEPATDPACWARYVQAIPEHSPLWRRAAPFSPEEALPILEDNLLDHMTALFGDGVRVEAQAFIRATPFYVEWEGMAENPLSEADAVASWLEAHPRSRLTPFLRLLQAHRLGSACQMARGGERGVLAARFRTALEPVLNSADPLLTCLARDLDRHLCSGNAP